MNVGWKMVSCLPPKSSSPPLAFSSLLSFSASRSFMVLVAMAALGVPLCEKEARHCLMTMPPAFLSVILNFSLNSVRISSLLSSFSTRASNFCE